MASDDYIDEYEKLESKTASLSCKICNEDMKHNLFAINKHMEVNHRMDALAYGTKYKLTNHKASFQQFEDSANGRTTSFDEIPVVMVDLKWYLGSQFQCQICMNVFYASKDLSTHLKKSHSYETDNYQKIYGSLLTKAETYRCQVCDGDVDHDEKSIYR